MFKSYLKKEVIPVSEFRKMKVKRKKIKRAKAYDEVYLWPWFSKFIRLRDSDHNGMVRCFTCNVSRFWTECDAGHGIPRQHKETKYNEINSKGQCKHCNGFHGGMREVFKQRMDEIHGAGTWEKLEAAARKVCKKTKFEYDMMIDHYKNEVKKLRELKGI